MCYVWPWKLNFTVKWFVDNTKFCAIIMEQSLYGSIYRFTTTPSYFVDDVNCCLKLLKKHNSKSVAWRKFWGYTPRIRSVFTNHSNAMKINQYGSNKNYCWGRLIELLINIRIFELVFGLSIFSQKPKCSQ